jgi:hypothetical protein
MYDAHVDETLHTHTEREREREREILPNRCMMHMLMKHFLKQYFEALSKEFEKKMFSYLKNGVLDLVKNARNINLYFP